MLTDFLDKYRVEWSKQHKHSRPGWSQLQHCPHCHSDNYHLGIKDDMSRASCYRCGGKSVYKILREVTNAPHGDLQAVLGERAFVKHEAAPGLGIYTPPTQLQPIGEVLSVHNYVRERGFDIDYLESIWKLQATGNFSNYPRRLFIPIFQGSRPVSWTARAAVGQQPRYQTANNQEKSFPEKHLLFGNQFVRDIAIVTEGPLSAIRVGRGAVATFGLSYSQEQVLWLSTIWKRVIVFDNTPDAQQRARELATKLSIFPGKTIVVNLDAADPGEATQAEVSQLRDFAGLPEEI